MSRASRLLRTKPIREFVYLDEVSVESLLASVDGEILVETTHSRSRSTEAGFGGSVKATSLFDQASFTSNLKRTRSQGVQELRKSVAQSAFARFRGKNIGRFAIHPHGVVRGRLGDSRRLTNLDAKTLRRTRQGIPLALLRRGDLLEMEVTLAASNIYKVRTALDAIGGVADAYPDFVDVEQREIFRMVRPLISLIDKLNGDAIPVVASQPSIGLAEIDGAPWLLQQNGESQSSVVLESVAMPQWFWGDVGRTLFQEHRLNVLCRVVDPVLASAASGSYVGDILRVVEPGIAQTVDGFGDMFLGALRSGASGQKSTGSSLAEMAADYVSQVSLAFGLEPGNHEYVVASLGLSGEAKLLDLRSQNDLFAVLDSAAGLGIPSEPDTLARIRDATRTKHDLWPWSPTASNDDPEKTEADQKYLKVEIVAAYW